MQRMGTNQSKKKPRDEAGSWFDGLMSIDQRRRRNISMEPMATSMMLAGSGIWLKVW